MAEETTGDSRMTWERELEWQFWWESTRQQREIEAQLSRAGYRPRSRPGSIRIELDGSLTEYPLSVTCSLCYQEYPGDKCENCRSCLEWFCDKCFGSHFTTGPHIVYQQNGPTEWYRETDSAWSHILTDGYCDDGTGRGIQIPQTVPI